MFERHKQLYQDFDADIILKEKGEQEKGDDEREEGDDEIRIAYEQNISYNDGFNQKNLKRDIWHCF